MIPVTKPYLPDSQVFEKHIKGIWERQWLTNDGPLLRELEQTIPEKLGCKALRIVNNGTTAIQLAIRALEITGKVITTPFSYIATTSSLVWEGCTPIFADIDPNTFNIAPDSIEPLIDDEVEAIVATHCFGVPCDIDRINSIAQKHGLKVIYDAAHCFGSLYNGKSVFDFGDISVASFHATKIYHMVEGGGIFTSNSKLLRKVELLRNFGHDGPHQYTGVGINGKNSELHAAMGLCVLNDVDSLLLRRKEQYEHYRSLLETANVTLQSQCSSGICNYSYFPVLLSSERQIERSIDVLDSSGIQVRRYFYPTLNQVEYIHEKGTTPVADDIAKRIICLPMYHQLKEGEQQTIVETLLDSLQ